MQTATTTTTEPPRWTVPRLCEGATVVCVASGPSLTEAQVEWARNRARVIVVNDNYMLAPWADVLYACDLKWWRWHYEEVSRVFRGKYMVTQDLNAAKEFPGLLYLKSAAKPGLSRDQGVIHQGQNGGFQAVNLAVLMGAKKVVLIGYDMKQADNGLRHWFGEHPEPVHSQYNSWIPRYGEIAVDAAAIGVDVVNCSLDTALECFRKSDIEDEV